MGNSTQVGFFTAVNFGNNQPKTHSQSLLETVDSYFNFGGHKAFVIREESPPGQNNVVITKDTPSSYITTALKASSVSCSSLLALNISGIRP